MSVVDKLKALASATEGLIGIATGVAPVISNVVQLAGFLKAVASDLEKTPTDPATGLPLTLDQAHARVDLATTKSHAQDDRIRTNAAAALAENARETGGTPPPADASAPPKE